tara:strand:- start:1546 stop:2127 length:582 start_codon:yes stop_codon:yes gene_type:complete
MIPKDKETLRKKQLQKRNNLSKRDHEKKSLQIQTHLTLFLKQQQFDMLGSFFPVENEPDIWPILQPFGQQLALPVFNNQKKHYHWGPYTPPLLNSVFNIPEPPTQFKYQPELDICLVPALGIAPNGHRIGWGYGYFDRLISKKIPIRIGVIFDTQQLHHTFANDPWDVPVTHILTESGLKKIEFSDNPRNSSS